MPTLKRFALILLVVAGMVSLASAQNAPTHSVDELAPGSPQLITPENLLELLQNPKDEKPLILNVGPWLLFRQAHIPGAEYVGAGSEKQGLEQLRAKVKSLPHKNFIVLYCGCCPWSHCPNVRPAFKELSSMGFTNVKVLYIADNFGTDWVYKGYPTVKGQ
ncbi:MAG TPA: rhodanese-like domain-containing protein [Terriglobales bacterium]